MWRRHYIIPEYIPTAGQQEVCWEIQSAEQTEIISLKCIVTAARPRWNRFFLENTTFPAKTGEQGAKQGKFVDRFSTGSHSADFEKCNVILQLRHHQVTKIVL